MPLGGFYTTGNISAVIATVTISIASPAVVSHAAHGLADGDTVKFSTTGALPTGVVGGTVYYLVNLSINAYQLAATPGGTPIITTGTQSGVHSVTTGLIVGSGTLWTQFGLQDDEIFANGAIGLINSVPDDTHIKLILPWTGGALVAQPYVLRQRSWQRYDPSTSLAISLDARSLLRGSGLIYYVIGSIPDPGIGQDGQVAIKFTSVGGMLNLQSWLKTSGVWVLQTNPWPPPRTQRSIVNAAVVIGTTDIVLNLSINAPQTITLPLSSSRAGIPLTFNDVGAQAGTNNLTFVPNASEPNLATSIGGRPNARMMQNRQVLTLTPLNDGVNTGWTFG